MISYEDYIDSSLEGVPGSELLYDFKRSLLEEMTERANSLLQKGLTDEKVIDDLIISEYPDLRKKYRQLIRKERAERRARSRAALAAVGSAAYALGLTCIFLAVSFTTGLWGKTWLIMTGGITLALTAAALMLAGSSVRKRGIFRPLSRIFLAGAVMLVATFIFLCLVFLTEAAFPWLVFPGGAIAALITDSIYAAATRQRLAVINYLLYIPLGAAIAFVMAGASGVLPWHPGWLTVMGAVLIDLFIIMGLIANNSKHIKKGEVLDLWKED